jgi:hypothetical protein
MEQTIRQAGQTQHIVRGTVYTKRLEKSNTGSCHVLLLYGLWGEISRTDRGPDRNGYVDSGNQHNFCPENDVQQPAAVVKDQRKIFPIA